MLLKQRPLLKTLLLLRKTWALMLSWYHKDRKTIGGVLNLFSLTFPFKQQTPPVSFLNLTAWQD